MSRTGSRPGRIMVKDEDVCLHCGLCAERCPTGAWDMQKFLLDMTHAGSRAGRAEAAGVDGSLRARRRSAMPRTRIAAT